MLAFQASSYYEIKTKIFNYDTKANFICNNYNHYSLQVSVFTPNHYPWTEKTFCVQIRGSLPFEETCNIELLER